jgi:hypothetical protein
MTVLPDFLLGHPNLLGSGRRHIVVDRRKGLRDIRFWHKADASIVPMSVCFWENSGHSLNLAKRFIIGDGRRVFCGIKRHGQTGRMDVWWEILSVLAPVFGLAVLGLIILYAVSRAPRRPQ